MKNEIMPTFSSSLHRATAYLATFIVGAAIVSCVGALPFLHRKYPITPTILLSICILATAVFISIAIPHLTV